MSRKSTGHMVATKLLLWQNPDPLQMVVSVKKIHPNLWQDKLGEREFIVCVLYRAVDPHSIFEHLDPAVVFFSCKIIKDCSEIRNN